MYIRLFDCDAHGHGHGSLLHVFWVPVTSVAVGYNYPSFASWKYRAGNHIKSASSSLAAWGTLTPWEHGMMLVANNLYHGHFQLRKNLPAKSLVRNVMVGRLSQSPQPSLQMDFC